MSWIFTEDKSMNTKTLALLILLPASFSLAGCTTVALVGAAGSTAIGAGKLAVKGTTAAIDAVIPGDEDDKKKKK